MFSLFFRFFKYVNTGVFGLSLLTASLFGQATTARLDGTVQDASGSVIPNAKITALENRTQVSSSATANAEGHFVFTTLQPGVYTLTVEANGFRKAILNDFELTVAGTRSEIIKLEVGQTSESVSIEASSAVVQTTDSSISRAINIKEVELLPQLNRTPITLAIFQPGVQIDVRAGQDSSFSHVNGLRQGSNNSQLDGIDINDSVAPRLGLSLTANNTDSVGEFRVVTAGGTAEYGRNAGAQVEMVTRSGTNQYHGAAFDYLRNTDLNANDFFNNSSGTAVPQLIKNIYGGSFGAPIKHNKTFIFGNFQGTRTQQQTIRVRTVPTATAKLGIFQWRDTSGALQQYNFAANDPAHIGVDSSVAKLLAQYPAGNTTSVGDGLNTTGFSFNNPVPSLEDQFTIRGDHRITDNQLVFLRWSWQRNTSIDNLNNADATFPGQPQGSQGGHRWGFAAGYTWTINPTLVNDFHAGHQSASVMFLRPNRPDGPAIGFNSFTNIQFQTFQQDRNSPVNDFTDTITKVKGNHTLKAGVSLRFTKQFGDNYAGVYPTYTTANSNNAVVPTSVAPPGLNATQTTTFNNLYNDVLGRISTVAQTYYSNLVTFQPAGQPRVRNFLWNESGYFFQDDWRVNRKLTLNLGIRYEYFGAPHEQDNLQGALTNATAVNGVTQVDGLTIQATNQWYGKDWNNFAPRVGFAYDLTGDGKTAIRGFYGIFFDRQVGAVISSADGNTPGFANGLTAFPAADARYAQLPAPPAQPAAPVLTLPDTRSTSITLFNPNLRTGYVHSYNLTVQRQLFKGAILEAGYVGNRGVKLFFNQDVNQPRLNPDFITSFQQIQSYIGNTSTPVPATNFFTRVYGSPAAAVSALTATNFTQGNVGTIINTLDVSKYTLLTTAGYSNFYFRNYPQFTQVILGTNNGRSYYDSLQVSVRKNSRNLNVNANYTFAKSMDNISAEGNGFTTAIDNFNLALNKARSDFDRPHSFNATAIYKLPVGKGQALGSSMPRFLDTLIGGWDVSALVIMQSGQPFSVSSQHPTVAVSGVGNTYANFSGTAPSGSVQRTGGGVFFYTADQVAQFSNPGAFIIGNSGRNVFRNPAFYELDSSLAKRFKINEKHSISFRAEAYNLFNHPNFGLAAANLNINTPATFGKFSSTLGTQVGGSSARTMQAVLRYDF
jgi:Carboxypeptidase regulatory-like domain/TonB dependent receptor